MPTVKRLASALLALVFVVMASLPAPVLAATGLTGPYAPANWTITGPGTTSIGSQVTAGDFSYNLSGSAVFSPQSWEFGANADATGPVSFDWNYSGFHAWFMVRVQLSAFADGPGGRTVVPLVNAGPVNCCSAPSGGFNYSGNTTLNVTQGYKFGLIAGGQNGDSDARLLGTIILTNFTAPDAPADSTKPVITASASTGSGAYTAGAWTNQDVTVSFTCTDAGGSGIATNTVAGATVSATAASVTNTGTCVDGAGNVADAASFGPINIDKRKPELWGTASTANGPYASGTWTNLDVTASFICLDEGGSGIAINTVGGSTVTSNSTNASTPNTGTCVDGAGNVADTGYFAGINIDKTAPVITASASTAGGAYAAGAWTNQDVTVSFTCADAGGSGIATNTVAGATVSATNAAVANTGACVDTAGNAAAAASFGPVNIDKIEPVISASASTPSGAYTAGSWTNQDVTVSFTCADLGGSGIATNTVAGATVSASAASVSNTGACVDSAGNAADTASFGPVNIDKTDPTVTYSGNAGTYTVDQTINITCTAADPTPGSGLASDTCADITGPAYTFALGTNTFSAQAQDAVGNVGTGSTSFTVTVTGQSINNLIDQLGLDASVAGSLKAQIDSIAKAPNANAKAGKLKAFQNHVEAQRGKKLTDAQADLLLTLAGAL